MTENYGYSFVNTSIIDDCHGAVYHFTAPVSKEEILPYFKEIISASKMIGWKDSHLIKAIPDNIRLPTYYYIQGKVLIKDEK